MHITKIIIFAVIMKYIIRAIKYYLYMVILVVIILAALAFMHLTEWNAATMFRNGYESIWQLALAFLAIALIYPKFGFNRRGVIIPGEYSEIRDGIVSYMEDHGYALETEEGENLTFRAKSPVRRITRFFEDRITMTRDFGGFYVEGLTKDIVRIINGLEYKFRTPQV